MSVAVLRSQYVPWRVVLWPIPHQPRLQETLDRFLVDSESFRQTLAVHGDESLAVPHIVDFERDFEDDVVRVFMPPAEPSYMGSRTAERWLTRLPISCFPRSFHFVLIDPLSLSGSA